MQVGDVVLLKTDGDSDLRWVGVVKFVDGDFCEITTICTNFRDTDALLSYGLTPEDLVVLGNVSQSVPVSAPTET